MFQPHRPRPKIIIFGPFRPLNVEENGVPDGGRQKYTEKRRRWCQNGASGVHMASQGCPRVSKMPPKSLPNSSKNCVLGPGPPRRPPKAPPGSKKYPKSTKIDGKTSKKCRTREKKNAIVTPLQSQKRVWKSTTVRKSNYNCEGDM